MHVTVQVEVRDFPVSMASLTADPTKGMPSGLLPRSSAVVLAQVDAAGGSTAGIFSTNKQPQVNVLLHQSNIKRLGKKESALIIVIKTLLQQYGATRALVLALYPGGVSRGCQTACTLLCCSVRHNLIYLARVWL